MFDVPCRRLTCIVQFFICLIIGIMLKQKSRVYQRYPGIVGEAGSPLEEVVKWSENPKKPEDGQGTLYEKADLPHSIHLFYGSDCHSFPCSICGTSHPLGCLN